MCTNDALCSDEKAREEDALWTKGSYNRSDDDVSGYESVVRKLAAADVRRCKERR